VNSFIAKLLTLFVLILVLPSTIADAKTWPGKETDFHGFKQHNFSVDKLKCRVVVPKEIAAGTPWIWRARFFGHQPQVDVALLEKGFHVAYVDVSKLYGSSEAMARWDAFYKYLTSEKGFSKKPALEGMSRGGLIVYRWASQNPDRVACIYADAPVCDIKSWPAGRRNGEGDTKSWTQFLAANELTEAEALTYSHNPIDILAPLAAKNVPLLHVVGDADKVVLVAENTTALETRYKELGGFIEVIHKPGVGHHPHCLKDPKPIVDFILQHSTTTNDLVRVACVGDSITFGAKIKDRENQSYPAQLGQMLGQGYQVKNFGRSGATLLNNGDQPYQQTPNFKSARDFKPNIVIIKLGTNDSKPKNWVHGDDFVADYVELIENFRALPSQPIVHICYPVPAFPGNFEITDKVIKENILPKIDTVAKKAKVKIIDLYEALSGREDLFPDRVHPNSGGAKIMAETIGAFLQNATQQELELQNELHPSAE